MPVDGKKKKKSKVVSLPPDIATQPLEISSDETETEGEETEEENEDEDPDYQENDSSENDGSSSASDIEEDNDDATTSSVMKKTPAKRVKQEVGEKKGIKRKHSPANNPPKKTKKTKVNEEASLDEERPEKTRLESAEKDKVAEKKGEKKGGKKEAPVFSDKNCDYDLFNNAAANVIPRKIKLSSNVIITCRMIEQIEGKALTYDYPAITLQRKTGNGKLYEFNLPMGLAPKIIEAVQLIMKDNTKFFNMGMTV